jgi:very-short-patch-repair endonuclease
MMRLLPHEVGEGVRQDLGVVRRFADGRLGVVTLDDLRRHGVTAQRVSRLVAAGELERLHRSVYRFAGTARSVEQRVFAACRAVGDDAVASDRTAGALWRIAPAHEGSVRVTIPRRRRSAHPDIVVHRRELGPHEITRLGPIPITRVPRTIADLDRALRAPAIDEALRRSLTRLDQLLGFDQHLDALARDRMHHGVPESELERRALAMIKRARLPQPVRHVPVATYRIDLAYPEAMLAIELDGREYHVTRERWNHDLRRQNELELAGWRVLRFTWADVTSRTEATVEQIRRALSGARSPSRGDRRGRPGAR